MIVFIMSPDKIAPPVHNEGQFATQLKPILPQAVRPRSWPRHLWGFATWGPGTKSMESRVLMVAASTSVLGFKEMAVGRGGCPLYRPFRVLVLRLAPPHLVVESPDPSNMLGSPAFRFSRIRHGLHLWRPHGCHHIPQCGPCHLFTSVQDGGLTSPRTINNLGKGG